jgi:outer membrane protein assembly factor BamB
VACAFCTLVRTPGLRGGGFEFQWRWSATPEERLLAREKSEPDLLPPAEPAKVAVVPPVVPSSDSQAPTLPRTPAPEWPGFRGPQRDGIVRDVRIDPDWANSPPAELWRRPIGPGWSSFAVHQDLIYTQEQRGGDELVSAYRLSTGAPVWRHSDATRFYESNGGAGPRGTPTVHNGRVYAFGATGILNVLDAASGAVLWSRNAAMDTQVAVPTWGFSSSPLVIDDIVVVATEGTVVAYDLASGKQRWISPAGRFSYSSPHLLSIHGIRQILMLNGNGVLSLAPADGAVLWQDAWEAGAVVQPAMTADGDVLFHGIGMTGGQGIRRLAISYAAGSWKVAERWTSSGLKPYFNDFVVHKGHAFGFDGSILSSIDLTDGRRNWKGGRYGSGQLVLLAEQDVLLVLSDEGELALVRAAPTEFQELARFKAIEGKTWNHPVVVGQTVLVRNGEEMAAFRLAAP